jgi:aubergine-like protein
VTNQHRQDFFLIPQSVRQGTVNPVNFNVCVNTGLGLDMGKFQILTYMLCHLYYNWPGTVRVPAPVQYAHKLAFLVGQSLHRVPNRGLDKLLFYL